MAYKKFHEEKGEATVKRTWTEIYIRQKEFYNVPASKTYGYHEMWTQMLPDNFHADRGLYPVDPQDYEQYF